MKKPITTIQCGCGCGATLTTPDRKCRPRRFLPGHNTRLSNPGFEVIAKMPKPVRGEQYKADGTHWRTARWRARSITDHARCSWERIGGCRGPIQVAHVDGDFTNGDASNLLSLCVSHHHLLDNGRIDPSNPVMPLFYTDRSGKRRYPWNCKGHDWEKERQAQSPYWNKERVRES